MTATAEKKQKKAKKARKTKGESLVEVVELLEKIEHAEAAVSEAELEMESRREDLKTAKGVWHSRVSELRELVRTRQRWAEEAKRQPLFNHANAPATDAQQDGAQSDSPATALSEAGKPLEDLGISAKRCEMLGMAGMHTVAELRAAMQRNPQGWYVDIKGIGREAATDIEDRVNSAT